MAKNKQEAEDLAEQLGAKEALPSTLEVRVATLEDELARLKKYLNVPEEAHG